MQAALDHSIGLIYRPFGVLFGVLAGLIGKKLFDLMWTNIDDEEPPEPATEETTWGRVIMTAAIEGVIFRVTRVVVGRYGAIGFHYLTGVWPGEKRPDEFTGYS